MLRISTSLKTFSYPKFFSRTFRTCLESALKNSERTAIVSENGTKLSYSRLLKDSFNLQKRIEEKIQVSPSTPKKISYLLHRDYSYVVAQWAVWRSGGVGVPLCDTHPISEIDYVLSDSQSSLLIIDPLFSDAEKLALERNIPILKLNGQQLGKQELVDQVEVQEQQNSFQNIPSDNDALIVYTSGTTSKPKGVVLTHGNLESQVKSLHKAWEWTKDDRILHILPLHHVHGIVNVLNCAMWANATCEFLPKFDPLKIWKILSRDPQDPDSLTLFMGVPTNYSLLISSFEAMDSPTQEKISSILKSPSSKIRLMVSGSAALPPSIMNKWEEITGHKLLERYGMTEIGLKDYLI